MIKRPCLARYLRLRNVHVHDHHSLSFLFPIFLVKTEAFFTWLLKYDCPHNCTQILNLLEFFCYCSFSFRYFTQQRMMMNFDWNVMVLLASVLYTVKSRFRACALFSGKLALRSWTPTVRALWLLDTTFFSHVRGVYWLLYIVLKHVFLNNIWVL